MTERATHQPTDEIAVFLIGMRFNKPWRPTRGCPPSSRCRACCAALARPGRRLLGFRPLRGERGCRRDTYCATSRRSTPTRTSRRGIAPPGRAFNQQPSACPPLHLARDLRGRPGRRSTRRCRQPAWLARSASSRSPRASARPAPACARVRALIARCAESQRRGWWLGAMAVLDHPGVEAIRRWVRPAWGWRMLSAPPSMKTPGR